MMQIKALNKDAESLKKHLAGKKRIMTYGAGTLANDIKIVLEKFGYKLDCAIVDDEYYNEKAGAAWEDITVASLKTLRPPYSPESDAVIWAIASPEKLHGCMEDDRMTECFLIWNVNDFWDDRDYPAVHREEFDSARELLCDEYSKKVFDSYIEAQKGTVEEDIRYSTEGAYFNNLTGGGYREGAFLDCGAYDGQNAFDYMTFIGQECKVYAFEPDQMNYRKLADRVKNRSHFICLNKGCYSSEKQMSFAANADMSSSLQEGGNEIVEVTTIDGAVGEDKVAFIKLDIEGAELEALKGARKVIRRDMPVLAVSAYHKQEDLITLLPYISELCGRNKRYKLYLRHHGVVQTELVIYAIPFED